MIATKISANNGIEVNKNEPVGRVYFTDGHYSENRLPKLKQFRNAAFRWVTIVYQTVENYNELERRSKNVLIHTLFLRTCADQCICVVDSPRTQASLCTGDTQGMPRHILSYEPVMKGRRLHIARG